MSVSDSSKTISALLSQGVFTSQRRSVTLADVQTLVTSPLAKLDEQLRKVNTIRPTEVNANAHKLFAQFLQPTVKSIISPAGSNLESPTIESTEDTNSPSMRR